ncbi:P-loop containing nucleoside triphosphate hydrolase protein [Dipodascopsis tothii]|uniref:P-loop containing nucleoside triphosphate hydrolase protein n=1 Tax=Dipodascopsis tothii TaxID=44089 RepID=UPI0034CE5902
MSASPGERPKKKYYIVPPPAKPSPSGSSPPTPSRTPTLIRPSPTPDPRPQTPTSPSRTLSRAATRSMVNLKTGRHEPPKLYVPAGTRSPSRSPSRASAAESDDDAPVLRRAGSAASLRSESSPRSPLRRPARDGAASPAPRPATALALSSAAMASSTSLAGSTHSADTASGQGNIRVVVRVRPFVERERERHQPSLIEMDARAGVTVIHPPRLDDATPSRLAAKDAQEPKRFVFDESIWSLDKASPDFVDQEGVYLKLGREFLEHNFEGYHTCIFAYGQTGSGKSFTMMGSDDEPGIIPRTCEDLFAKVDELNSASVCCTIRVSYFEIYNEHVYDLLAPPAAPTQTPVPLKVRESPVDGPYVKDLSEFTVKTFADVKKHLKTGNRYRSTASTNMNDSSSRSHAVFTLEVKQTNYDPGLDETQETVSRIRFVDLAGSERANSTGATGFRLREGANINKSLSTLGRVISALADASSGKKKDLVPYRDSTLTWLLKDSLGGNSKTAMIACVSPCDYDESLSTLRYAEQAKNIRTRAIVNQDFISGAERGAQLAEMRETMQMLQTTLSQNSELKEQNETQTQELEKIRRAVRFYEEQADVEEAKRKAITAHNEAVRRHNALMAEHVRDLTARLELEARPPPAALLDEWNCLVQDADAFRAALRQDPSRRTSGAVAAC